jgi:hypothetical protein
MKKHSLHSSPVNRTHPPRPTPKHHPMRNNNKKKAFAMKKHHRMESATAALYSCRPARSRASTPLRACGAALRGGGSSWSRKRGRRPGSVTTSETSSAPRSKGSGRLACHTCTDAIYMCTGAGAAPLARCKLMRRNILPSHDAKYYGTIHPRASRPPPPTDVHRPNRNPPIPTYASRWM